MFDIDGKIALITGGASGIGLQTAKELLRNGLKACTLADVDENRGNQAVKEILDEFGKNRAIFVKTDVTVRNEFEEAFKATVNTFKNIDILINNAGIFDDFNWEKEILINLNGTIHGCLLGLEEYLPKYKSDNEAVLVNVSSISGLDAFGSSPVYSATKHAVLGLSRSFGVDLHYKRTKVKVLTICPGQTNTTLLNSFALEPKTLSPVYQQLFEYENTNLRVQPSLFVAQCMVRMIKKGENGSVWLVENEKPPSEIIFTNRYERLKESAENL